MRMWPNTRITERLKIRYPIIQGPFGGGLSSVKLAATVSNAGGLGSFGAHYLDGAGITRIATELRAATDKPFALNLWISSHDPGGGTLTSEQFAAALEDFKPFYDALKIAPPPMPAQFGQHYEDQIQALLDARPAVFSFVFGIPSTEVFAECRKRDIVTVGAITTPDEAIAMEKAGVDVIVATGFEAGGHRPSFLRSAEDSLGGTFSLVQTTAAVVKAPIIAAGGIANARGIRAALALGAQGAQLGTAFLATEESNASALHRDALFSERGRHTMLTRQFSGRLARGLRNAFAERAQKPLPYPIQNWFVGSFRAAATAQGKSEWTSMWAGQSTPLIKHRRAADLFADLVREME